MLEARDIVVQFGERAVLDGISLRVTDGEVLALLGASGAGKSTLLRVLAGLLVPDRGTVWLDGRDVSDVPAHRRRIGLMFQDEQLFPHLTVEQNVAFGLRMQRTPRGEIAQRVRAMLELVGMPGFGQRHVAKLSGGEAKRVALARALAPEPAVLLLDEPLTGLDRELHDRLAVDLAAVLRSTGTTAILVTHDHDEAAVIADRVMGLAS
jgi:thiamine transport system ATP-binding protein